MAGGWGEFIAAFAAFFSTHVLFVRPAVKRPVVAAIGPRGFTLAYSAVSVAVLSGIVVAAIRAPVVVLWSDTTLARHTALALMLVASVLFTLAIGRPNPLSFGGAHDERFDPARPGLIGWIRHPLLWVLFIWSLAHILANGTLSYVIMFGAFALFALAGVKVIDRRKRRLLGAGEWARLAAGPRRLSPTRDGLVRLVAGVALYALLLWLHGPVIGVDPLG